MKQVRVVFYEARNKQLLSLDTLTIQAGINAALEELEQEGNRVVAVTSSSTDDIHYTTILYETPSLVESIGNTQHLVS